MDTETKEGAQATIPKDSLALVSVHTGQSLGDMLKQVGNRLTFTPKTGDD